MKERYLRSSGVVLGLAAAVLAVSSCESQERGGNATSEHLHSCNKNNDVPYNIDEKASKTAVSSMSAFKTETGRKLIQLYAAVQQRGNSVSHQAAYVGGRGADVTYGSKTTPTSLTIVFPQDTFRGNQSVTFAMHEGAPEAISDAAIVCYENGQVYPNGVTKVVDRLLEQDPPLTALDK